MVNERFIQAERDRNDLRKEVATIERRAKRLGKHNGATPGDETMLRKLEKDMWQQVDRLKGENAILEAKVKDLEEGLAKWKYWKSRQAEITSYLELLAPMAQCARTLPTPPNGHANSLQRAYGDERTALEIGTRCSKRCPQHAAFRCEHSSTKAPPAAPPVRSRTVPRQWRWRRP